MRFEESHSTFKLEQTSGSKKNLQVADLGKAKGGSTSTYVTALIDDCKLELFSNSSLLVDLCSKIGWKKWDLKQKVL